MSTTFSKAASTLDPSRDSNQRIRPTTKASETATTAIQ